MFEPIDLESENEMGPGTDLVLSLLAVIITVLAVVGISQQVVVAEKDCEIEQCNPTENEDYMAELHSQLLASKIEINELKSELVDKTVTDETAFQDNVVELHEESFAIFERNRAQLRDKDLPLLKKELVPLYDAVSVNFANIIRIHGHASPEPRPGGRDKSLDGNMDLSVQRSLTILHAMHRLGVPYKCMVVEGYGRSRSKFLNGYLEYKKMSVESWDKMYLGGFDTDLQESEKQKMFERLENLYKQDRRVTLVAVIENDSPCKTGKLKEVLKTTLF